MNTKFGVGKVLGTGFRIWIRNFVPFVVLTALMHSPIVIWGVLVVQGDHGLEQIEHVIRFLGTSFYLAPLLDILVSAVLAYGVVMELQGQRVSIFACIATGFRRLFPALGTTISACICIAAGGFAGALPGFVIDSEVGVGISACLVALYFYSMFYIAPQASVIDRAGMGDALLRSQALTRGHRFAIIGLLLLLLALAFGLTILLLAIPVGLRALVYLDLARSVLVGSLSATMAGVAYYFLRAEKEGTSATELAVVFD